MVLLQRELVLLPNDILPPFGIGEPADVDVVSNSPPESALEPLGHGLALDAMAGREGAEVVGNDDDLSAFVEQGLQCLVDHGDVVRISEVGVVPGGGQLGRHDREPPAPEGAQDRLVVHRAVESGMYQKDGGLLGSHLHFWPSREQDASAARASGVQVEADSCPQSESSEDRKV